MNKVHNNPLLENSQLNFVGLLLDEPGIINFSTNFTLSSPYLILPNGVWPCFQRSYFLRAIFYKPISIDEYISRNVPSLLKLMLEERDLTLRQQEFHLVSSRLFEPDEITLDGKFKINAFQVEGRLEYTKEIEDSIFSTFSYHPRRNP